ISGATFSARRQGTGKHPTAKREMARMVGKTPAAMIPTAFADLPQATAAVPKNETVAAVPSVMFNERFAAAAPESVAPAPVEGVKLASATPSIDVSLPAEPAKKTSASASVQIAMAPATKPVERV